MGIGHFAPTGTGCVPGIEHEGTVGQFHHLVLVHHSAHRVASMPGDAVIIGIDRLGLLADAVAHRHLGNETSSVGAVEHTLCPALMPRIVSEWWDPG